MSAPWLSVVMPTYNGEAYVAAALESILVQGDPNIEVVAIDDGSTDGTRRVLERYRAKLSLRIVGQCHGGNWVASTNRGLAMSRGEFACFLHQDDVWLADRLRRLRRLVREVPDATLYLQPSYFIDAAGRRLGLCRCPLPAARTVLTPPLVVPRLLVQNFIATPAPIFRREAARRVGFLEERLWYTADWDFWLRLARAGTIAYLPVPLSAFRVHALSQTITGSREPDTIRGQLRDALGPNLEAYCAACRADRTTRSVALFSADLNAGLAGYCHGDRPPLWPFFSRFVGLGLRGWLRFLHDSCIVGRALPRVRAGLLPCRARRRDLAASSGVRETPSQSPWFSNALDGSGQPVEMSP
jgi:hypothetical protein